MNVVDKYDDCLCECILQRGVKEGAVQSVKVFAV